MAAATSGASSGGSNGLPSAGTSNGGDGAEAIAGGGASANTAGNTSGGAVAAGNGGSGGGGFGGTPPIAAGGSAPATERCEIANYDAAKPPQTLALSGSLGTHDPVMMVADGRFYLFSTGNNVGAKTSTNMLQWQAASDVFSNATRPAWLLQAVPGVSNLWAPDISFFGGVYHLYYSASTFGSNRSCIGHLTRVSLTTGSWTDHGEVICSNATATKDNWNAIDPNVVVDEAGTPWLTFGSFWGGIKLIKLDAQGARVGTSLDSLAARPDASGAVEAPFIVRRCGFYYLFTSWDACCKGVDSTYNTRVGRSPVVTGPYVDKDGVALMQGGGTLLVKGGDRYKGPGHNAVVFTDTAAFNVYHSYDANNNGASVLRISELVWDSEGWPTSGGP
jgi:arabinan endo-1,5-alpha-L-arabinosidase